MSTVKDVLHFWFGAPGTEICGSFREAWFKKDPAFDDEIRRHFLGTHFFNPPRYLRLVELIPTPETDPEVIARLTGVIDRQLGKGVVTAKDTPNFIANHVGLFGVVQLIRALESGAYTIEEIDAITGPALGRPKSATFRKSASVA